MGKRRFAGTVKGPNQTENNRYHSESMMGHIRGWNTGIRVVARVGSDDEDIFEVYVTSGSNGGKNDKFVGEFANGYWYSQTELINA